MAKKMIFPLMFGLSWSNCFVVAGCMADAAS